MWDVFISYASEDKEIARTLAGKLKEGGCNVWYDDDILKVGDSLFRRIGEGVSQSRFGIAILSHNFFRKSWPQNELHAIVARESLDKMILLPVRHQISNEEVARHSLLLADRFSLDASMGIPGIARLLLEAILQVEQVKSKPSDSKQLEFEKVLQRLSLKRKQRRMLIWPAALTAFAGLVALLYHYNRPRVDFGWADIKFVDVTNQGGGLSLDAKTMERNQYLWCVRCEIQRRLYRAGCEGDTTTPRPCGSHSIANMLAWMKTNSGARKDTGEGRLYLTFKSNNLDRTWWVKGEGFVTEHPREGENNAERWKAELWSQPSRTFTNGQRIQLELQLTNPRIKTNNSVALYFFVSADDTQKWRSTDDDDANFGTNRVGHGMTRVFVQPLTLGLEPGQVHVATITRIKNHR